MDRWVDRSRLLPCDAMPSETKSSIWRNGAFLRVWTAATVSIFGSLITRLALPYVAILVLASGPLEVAGLRSAEIVAGLMFGLLAGAWVDRLRRRPVLIVADAGRAILLGSKAQIRASGAA